MREVLGGLTRSAMYVTIGRYMSDDDRNRLPTAEECVNLGARDWPVMLATPDAVHRYEEWLERHGVRCTSCDLVILTPYGPLTAEYVSPDTQMQCDDCANAGHEPRT